MFGFHLQVSQSMRTSTASLRSSGTFLTNVSKYSDPGTTIHIGAERTGKLVRLVLRDEGSAFHVEIPLAVGAGDDEGVERGLLTSFSRVKNERGTPCPPRRVLVLDDNDDAAETLAELLQGLGHDVKTAADGVHALRIAKLFRPEVCLLDLGLPVMDGYELARRLMQSNDLAVGARLIALTGYGQDGDKRRTAEAGFAGYLVNFEVLSRAVAPAALKDFHPPSSRFSAPGERGLGRILPARLA